MNWWDFNVKRRIYKSPLKTFSVFQRSRNGEGDILHRIHKSGLQYVQIGSDKEVSSRLDYELNNR